MKTQRWMARVGVVLGIGAFCVTPISLGQDCPDQVDSLHVSHYGFGEPRLMEGYEFYVYVVDYWCGRLCGCSITVFDASDPEGPRIVSKVSEGDRMTGTYIWPTDLSAYEDRLFTIDSSSRVDFVDVSDPSNPVLTKDYFRFDGDRAETVLSEIEVVGDLVYIATNDGLTVLDVSDIENPSEIGFFETSWEPSNLVVDSGYAYITEDEVGLRIIDVSNPPQPIDVGFWPATWEARDLDVSGEAAFVATGNDDIRIIDVSDDENPVEIATFETLGGTKTVSVDGPFAVVAVSEGVSIIDVSNPSKPSEAGLYTADASVRGALLDGPIAYVLANADESVPGTEDGIRVIDVSVPEHTVELASIEFVLRVMDVAVIENTMFTANGDLGVSVGPPYAQWKGGKLDTPGFARGVTPYGQYLFVADDHKGLRIIDVADPANLNEVGYVDTPGQARRVAVAGDYAYVADGEGGLRVIDISLPSDPVEVGFLNTDGNAADLALGGDGEYVYLADGQGGLRVIDVSDPTLPTDVTPESLSVLTGVRSVEVRHDRAFTASTNGTLNVLDISNPASPRLLREEGELRGFPTDIALSSIHIFVATKSNNGSGVDGVDVFELWPSDFRKVGEWDSPDGIPSGVTSSKGHAYVAAGGPGVEVLDTSCLISYWVELVAHQSGIGGSQWRSDVIIGGWSDLCIGNIATAFGLEFILHTTDGVITGDAAIRCGGSGVFEDIVGILGYEGKGALEIRAERPLSVSSRVYNLTESGTSGGYYPGYRSLDCLDDQHVARLYGLRQVEGEYRTNISVTNITDEVRWVYVSLQTAAGNSIGYFSFKIEPGMTVQSLQPFVRHANKPNLGWGNATVMSDKGGILASATVIDSRTNDAVVVPMTPGISYFVNN